MKKLSLALMLVLTMTASAFAQAADAKAKAEEILKQARAAIGSESKFKSLQALSAEGTVKQNIGDRQMESTLEIELMTPDKIKLSQVQQFGTNTRAFNGTSFWTEFVPAVGMGGPGGGGFQMRGAGGPGGPGGPGGGNASMTAIMNYMQTQQRYEMIRLLQSWFLAPPTSTQMQYAYVGEGPGPNGTKLDVIDSKSVDGVATRLYFDQESHRLVGISYKAKNMRQAFGGRQGRGPGAPGGPGGQPQAGQPGGNRPPQQGQTTPPAGAPAGQAGAPGQPGQGQQRPQMTPEERERMAKERAEAFEKSPDVDYRWAFDDFKSVGGLNIPHRLTKIEAGTPTEEWEITKFKVNPKLTADKFEKKEKAAN